MAESNNNNLDEQMKKCCLFDDQKKKKKMAEEPQTVEEKKMFDVFNELDDEEDDLEKILWMTQVIYENKLNLLKEHLLKEE